MWPGGLSLLRAAGSFTAHAAQVELHRSAATGRELPVSAVPATSALVCTTGHLLASLSTLAEADVGVALLDACASSGSSFAAAVGSGLLDGSSELSALGVLLARVALAGAVQALGWLRGMSAGDRKGCKDQFY